MPAKVSGAMPRTRRAPIARPSSSGTDRATPAYWKKTTTFQAWSSVGALPAASRWTTATTTPMSAGATASASHSPSARQNGVAVSTAKIGTAMLQATLASIHSAAGETGASLIHRDCAPSRSDGTTRAPSAARKTRRRTRLSHASAGSGETSDGAAVRCCAGAIDKVSPPRVCMPASTARL